MRRKQVVKKAEDVFGVKAVIDCTNISIDKYELFKYLKVRALRCVWADPNTIVEYEEESEDVECYWNGMGKKYGYTLYKNIRLVDYVPNYKKYYDKWQERLAQEKEKDERGNYVTKKASQSTIYDRIVSASYSHFNNE